MRTRRSSSFGNVPPGWPGPESFAAIGVLLVALLRRLDALKVLHFHKSKTNGEYVREYPGERAGRREFVQFITAFEHSIYGGSEAAGPTYDTMTILAQQVLRDASEKPQI